jgi:uncharacterized protein (DUF2164 family)
MLTKEEKVYFEKRLLEYFEQEYVWALKAFDRNLGEHWEIVHNATQRMLGLCYFWQGCGMNYDYIEKIFNDYKERLENLLTND